MLQNKLGAPCFSVCACAWPHKAQIDDSKGFFRRGILLKAEASHKFVQVRRATIIQGRTSLKVSTKEAPHSGMPMAPCQANRCKTSPQIHTQPKTKTFRRAPERAQSGAVVSPTRHDRGRSEAAEAQGKQRKPVRIASPKQRGDPRQSGRKRERNTHIHTQTAKHNRMKNHDRTCDSSERDSACKHDYGIPDWKPKQA
jgi:hypothetical protein